ncbi:MAG: hypothetical protein ROZ64_01680 [Burkholderiaceae bacterium]|nr:hypothetical protein [Burkholderiaceae bacterium]
MAKPNYAFQKRQRELAKKQKKEEKRLRKTDSPPEHDAGAVADDGAGAAMPAPTEQPAAAGGESKG